MHIHCSFKSNNNSIKYCKLSESHTIIGTMNTKFVCVQQNSKKVILSDVDMSHPFTLCSLVSCQL